jgi:hypothetical protein
MLTALKRHPFGVEAFFKRSLVLAYALPKDVLQPLLGPGLVVDAYEDFGFLAIALVQTEHLRPKGFPKAFGRSFFLSGYRIFTRFNRPGKQSLRGLRILRSDTDRRAMTLLGNVFTHYNYSLADVTVGHAEEQLHITVRTPNQEADLDVTADLASRPAPLPEGSPFRTMQEAEQFVGPLPYTFDHEAATGRMVMVKGLRQAWDPKPVHVTVREASYLQHPQFGGVAPRLANAFYVHDIPYAWKSGEVVPIEAPENR